MKYENDCLDKISFINAKGEFQKKCRKHYCICEDEIPFGKGLNEKYQQAKKIGMAGHGKFYIK